MSINDSVCGIEGGEMAFYQLGTKEKYIRWEHYDHFIFVAIPDPIFGIPLLRHGDKFMTRMVETIEFGTV